MPAGSEGEAERGRSDSDESSDSKRSFKAESSKKVFFSFYLPAEASAQAGKKKSGARKSKIEKKTFLRGGER
ncbi:MAG: hypothetical protein COT33_03590 [Candidatus Nealsonbacteria bacterium CG08_land_8_20_14_0_20_38_20]|uniref:Uncharacterized protein n=1 Tax=Candidatus Nealsonbacteria bacterium CG08_land_8_20_14_0_20_38_20 TaxID=1974705 RepID=A0A2H0YKV4_9BACT|nr:MAG: hypothetical protein COT33_03590 [Candidatus Nealsonbacteria bacterium CG08_land_8_20_14_0_20_38_20]